MCLATLKMLALCLAMVHSVWVWRCLSVFSRTDGVERHIVGLRGGGVLSENQSPSVPRTACIDLVAACHRLDGLLGIA